MPVGGSGSLCIKCYRICLVLSQFFCSCQLALHRPFCTRRHVLSLPVSHLFKATHRPDPSGSFPFFLVLDTLISSTVPNNSTGLRLSCRRPRLPCPCLHLSFRRACLSPLRDRELHVVAVWQRHSRCSLNIRSHVLRLLLAHMPRNSLLTAATERTRWFHLAQHILMVASTRTAAKSNTAHQSDVGWKC